MELIVSVVAELVVKGTFQKVTLAAEWQPGKLNVFKRRRLH